jgi:hypothetical protein
MVFTIVVSRFWYRIIATPQDGVQPRKNGFNFTLKYGSMHLVRAAIRKS